MSWQVLIGTVICYRHLLYEVYVIFLAQRKSREISIHAISILRFLDMLHPSHTY